MASSTKIPITTIIPKRDMILIVMLKFPANISIPRKEIGRPKATQKANLVFKNSDNNPKTRRIPKPPFSRRRLVLCLKTSE